MGWMESDVGTYGFSPSEDGPGDSAYIADHHKVGVMGDDYDIGVGDDNDVGDNAIGDNTDKWIAMVGPKWSRR